MWRICLPMIALGLLPGILEAQTHSADADAPSAQVAIWLEQLDHESAPVREQALDRLLGLRRSDLPALRDAVARAPLSPAQRAVLRPLVGHLYLTGEDFPARHYEARAGEAGFLGVLLGDVPVNLSPGGERAGSVVNMGVVIVDRIPGFCGYAALRDGDVVVGVRERPRIPFNQMQAMRQTIVSCRPGETIHLQVLRQGQMREVPVTLDPVPEALAGGNEMLYRQFLSRRADQAQAYWQQQFAPLVGGEAF